MNGEKLTVVKKMLEGWFATSFWVDIHYGLATLGTLVVFGMYIATKQFDLGLAGFDVGLWTTAIANDKVNLPPIPPA